ncbi:hypothetical protein D8Y22_07075 [Salinadaptatus halalkaliphilus]|uniref:DUF2795 domain-containing protein n=1 Tax=Salinadaptatus halalkaliphilus TaxID=2419781 RepID=A0A4S3TMT1_9EURY|nr:hypothetical protein [Salinadaptatus halalkaliphilus]THE65569.1 hypothetical protein D8Y22_07075 [Salinadaptatus halalkaliphilus]
MSQDGRDRDRVQDRAEQRTSSRAETTESILEDVERDLGDLEYPTTSEELATVYATEPIDLPNETESLGSIFDLLGGEQFEDPQAVREAVHGELTGQAGSPDEANPERDLTRLEDDKQGAPSEEATRCD